MGILSGLAGALTEGGKAVSDVGDQQLKLANQKMLNEQMADLHAKEEERITAYKNNLELSNQAKARERMQGYIVNTPEHQDAGPVGPNGEQPGMVPARLDMEASRMNALRAGDPLAEEAFNKASGAWRSSTNAYGKQVLFNDVTGETKDVADTGAQHEQIVKDRLASRTGPDALDAAIKRKKLLAQAVESELGAPKKDALGQDDPQYYGKFALAHAHAEDTFTDKDSSISPSINYANSASDRLWKIATTAAGGNQAKATDLYQQMVTRAVGTKAWRNPKAPAPVVNTPTVPGAPPAPTTPAPGILQAAAPAAAPTGTGYPVTDAINGVMQPVGDAASYAADFLAGNK